MRCLKRRLADVLLRLLQPLPDISPAPIPALADLR